MWLARWKIYILNFLLPKRCQLVRNMNVAGKQDVDCVCWGMRGSVAYYCHLEEHQCKFTRRLKVTSQRPEAKETVRGGSSGGVSPESRTHLQPEVEVISGNTVMQERETGG